MLARALPSLTTGDRAGLVGSGIITKQFKEIRQTVMDTVLETFFDAEFLANYIGQKVLLAWA